jgi:hypothetical protein
MCTLNEVARKSICGSVRKLCLIREVRSWGRDSKLMLRITIAETLTEQKWTLEGRLVRPWTSELKSTWTKTETARRERKCVVDLTDVTFIDKNGEKVLAELYKAGAELIATGCYTRHVVRNIERKKSNRQV